MSANETLRTVELNDKDIEKTQFLKEALRCKSEAEVIRESLNVTQRVISVIREGGTVVLTEKNGTANEIYIKP